MAPTYTEAQEPTFENIAPLLDGALENLGERDHTVVALRFWQGLSMQEIAAAAGGTEEAVRKRIGRALAKMRRYLGRRGVVPSAAGLATILAAGGSAKAAAPAGLASTVCTTALGAGGTVGTGALIAEGALKAMAWVKVKVAAVMIGAMAVAGGGGTVLVHRVVAQTAAAPVTQTPQTPVPRLQFRLVAENNSTAEADEWPGPSGRGQNPPVRVLKPVLLDESAVARAMVEPDGRGNYQVRIVFTEAGAQTFAQITGENIGRQLAMIFDGKLLSAPVIRSQIRSEAIIQGSVTQAEAQAIVDALNKVASTQRTATTKPATQASDQLIRPGDGIGPVRLDMAQDQVIAAMGQPERITGAAHEYLSKGLAVIYSPGPQPRVNSIMAGSGGAVGEAGQRLIDACTSRTAESLGMNSTLAQIAAAYGLPEETQRTAAGMIWRISYRSRGIEFFLRDNQVTWLNIRHVQ